LFYIALYYKSQNVKMQISPNYLHTYIQKYFFKGVCAKPNCWPRCGSIGSQQGAALNTATAASRRLGFAHTPW